MASRMNHKILIFTAVLLCGALLAGCVAEPGQKPEITTGPPDTTTADETGITNKEENEDPAELYILRSKIQEAECAVGIAFVDYVESDLSQQDTATYLRYSEIAEEYPFINNAETVAYSGMELFVLVPASKEGIITVFPAAITEEGEYTAYRDEIVYQSAPGEPVALRCNISESYANVLVSVTNGTETFEFYPMISLEDGWSIALQDGCYDFSMDNIRKYVYPVYIMLPQDFPEIQQAMDNGRELTYAGDFYFCDQLMLRFELGISDESGVVCEKQYAVSFDATYAMDPADHIWYVLGTGVNGMGLRG